MDRRTAVKNLAIVIGGAALLPSCTKSDPVIHFKNFSLHKDQQDLISNMAETIIPKTDTPGAIDLGLDKFVLLMLDDCTKKKDRDAFFAGIPKFNELTQKMYQKSFADCNTNERVAVLTALDNRDKNKPKTAVADKAKSDKDKKNIHPDELMVFFNTVKGLTVYGYTQSKYFMTKQVVYELVPGRYNAYVPVKNNRAEVKHG